MNAIHALSQLSYVPFLVNAECTIGMHNAGITKLAKIVSIVKPEQLTALEHGLSLFEKG